MSRFWNTDTGQIAVFCFLFLVIVSIFLYFKSQSKINHRTIEIFNLLTLMLLGTYIWRVTGFTNRNIDISTDFLHYWQENLSREMKPESSTEIIKPDIYYIILDGFGRSDVLGNLYGIDNSNFLKGLESRGFYIATESFSNYNQTTLSLASSLNMMYLDNVANTLGENTFYSYASFYLIENSIVENVLDTLGYQTVGFFSETSFTSFTGREYYFKPQGVPASELQTFLQNTAFSMFLNGQFYNWHRNTVNFALEKLPDVALMEGPQFTFVHIISPHPPFVFNADGTPRDNERTFSIADANRFMIDGTVDEYRTGYKEQIIYLQKKILLMLDLIQENSTDPFILILQGDHGPGSETNQDQLGLTNSIERHGILNAIYFYDQDYERLYPKISPVNTFRVIFSQYLLIDKPLLDDLHYSSTYGDSYNFKSVDDQLR